MNSQLEESAAAMLTSQNLALPTRQIMNIILTAAKQLKTPEKPEWSLARRLHLVRCHGDGLLFSLLERGMVRRTNHPNPVSDNGKIRFVYAEIEGNNLTLQNALATMLATANQTSQQFVSRKEVAPPVKTISGSALDNEPTLFNSQETVPEATDSAPTPPSDGISNGNGTTRRARGEGEKVDRNAGLVLVPDLDFVPSGKQSLKDFVSEKNLKTAEETVLLFVYYLKSVLATSAISANHVLTGFKHLQRKVPADLPQTIRNVVKNKGWLAGDPDNIRLTTEGENYVLHTMGKKATEKGE